MKKIVLDANILIKLFREESDSTIAFDLFEYLIKNQIHILAPELLITETMDVCISKGMDITEICHFFEKQIDITIIMQKITPVLLNVTSQMAKDGHPKSGYPSFNDSLYHCLAIQQKTVLITADKVHLNKTKKYGHIFLLKDWRKIIK